MTASLDLAARVQLDELWVGADFGHVARARQADVKFADGVRGRTCRQHHHAVAHGDCLVQVVRDEEHGLALRHPEVKHLVFHQLARLDVQRRKRFVHQDDVGVADQGLRQHGALAHAAGHLVRIAVAKVAQTHTFEPRVAACACFVLRHAGKFQPSGDVVQGAAPGQQRIALKHITRAVVDADKRFAKHRDLPGRGCQQSRTYVEQCRFAAARGADYRDELPRRNSQRGVAHGGIALPGIVARGEGAGDVFQQQRRVSHWDTAGWRGRRNRSSRPWQDQSRRP